MKGPSARASEEIGDDGDDEESASFGCFPQSLSRFCSRPFNGSGVLRRHKHDTPSLLREMDRFFLSRTGREREGRRRGLLGEARGNF